MTRSQMLIEELNLMDDSVGWRTNDPDKIKILVAKLCNIVTEFAHEVDILNKQVAALQAQLNVTANNLSYHLNQ